MNVLIIGSGGREHALAWKISQSQLLNQLYIAPGNAGTSGLGINTSLDVSDHSKVIDFCTVNSINLVVIGPEQPLVDGLADSLRKNQIRVIGPGSKGAQLEGSKSFAKQFMAHHNIPTASHRTFTIDTIEEGKQYIQSHSTPIVLKADGLAAGKGVLILDKHQDAIAAFEEMLNGQFGEASTTVVVEQFLAGIEFSVFALTDGEDYVLLPTAKDYKRIGEGDQGLNTGGMGTVSPVPFVDENLMQLVEDRIVRPTVDGLKKDQIPYQGFVFFGLINVDNEPYVIEYNCRLGDPETQVILPRLDSDLLQLFLATTDQSLSDHAVQVSKDYYTAVIMASQGYPGSYEKGKEIEIRTDASALVFHAGTKNSGESILTNGGRVLAACGRAESLRKSITHAYQQVRQIEFEGAVYRNDIGKDLLPYVSAE